MRLVSWLVLIGALLGVAGYIYFEHWYGLLTSLGTLAIRIGPMFLWRTILRTIRRQIIGFTFRFLPSFVKRWLREKARYIREAVRHTFTVWKSSWIIRVLIILPIIVLCVVLASDTDGIVEFLFLFPIPFLFTALFPEGFWAIMLVFGLNIIASHGLEQTAFWIASKVPWNFIGRYRAARDDIQRVLAERSRPMRTRIRKSLRLLRRAE